jgi:uncharacterized protein YjbI with pentapeptide repeats
MELILAFLAWIGLIEREEPPPPPPPPPVVQAPPPAPVVEERPRLAPPPDPLPAALGCREAPAKYRDLRNVPWRVDGRAIWGVYALARLRETWGDALIVVVGGDFSGWPLGGLRLHNMCFFGSDFTDSDWHEAETRGVGFIDSDFSGAWLDRSRMRGLLLDTVTLDGATAHGADWRGGLLQGGPRGSLKRVRLDGADLRGFRVDCGNRVGIDSSCLSSWGSLSLRGADLRGAEVDTLRAEVDWTGARLGGTLVNLHQLSEIGPARRLGPLIVRAGDVEVRLTPAEFEALRPFVHSQREPVAEPVAGRPPRLRPGTTSLFVKTPIHFDPAFRATRSTGVSSRCLPQIPCRGSSSLSAATVGSTPGATPSAPPTICATFPPGGFGWTAPPAGIPAPTGPGRAIRPNGATGRCRSCASAASGPKPISMHRPTLSIPGTAITSCAAPGRDSTRWSGCP